MVPRHNQQPTGVRQVRSPLQCKEAEADGMPYPVQGSCKGRQTAKLAKRRGKATTRILSRTTTPTFVMSIAAACAAVLAFAVIHVAMDQPWLGFRLHRDQTAGVLRVVHVVPGGPSAAIQPGQVLLSVGGIELEPDDLVEEPDMLDTYAGYERVLVRQGQLRERLLEPSVTLGLKGESSSITPAPHRPLTSLPLAFWIQLFAGVSGFLIGAWVWSLRLRDLTGWLMAIGGAGLLIMIFPAAIYSTRELALDPTLFRWLAAIDHFGALTFGVAMLALFYVYPYRLVPTTALVVLATLTGASWIADTAWIVFEGPPFGFHLPALILMLLLFPAAVMQYRLTRDDPVARAASRWFALSVCLGAGSFISLIVLPNVLGLDPALAQAPAFLLFIIVYGGIGIGVARYRLFELERWAFGVLFYVAGALMLVLLDAFLIFVLSLDQVAALGASLMAVALLYLPLRDALHRLIVGRGIDHGALFQQTVDVALTPPGADQNARWAELLRRAFKPLRIAESSLEDAPAHPMIRDDGLSLALPGFGDVGPVTLAYAHAGRKLFSREDQKLARELCMMLDHAIRSRQAREEGVAEERARISRDMHDNIGAKLLSALHSTGETRKNAMIRDALSDFRVIINNAFGADRPLDQTLAELRVETSERLESAGIKLNWETADESADALPAMIARTLCSIIREAVSNVIRHADATTVTISVVHHGGQVSVSINDDGRGIGDGDDGRGNGLANIRSRIGALGGVFEIHDCGPGTRLNVAFSC